MRLIDSAALDAISAAARRAPRGRLNLNFHHADADPSHRLLNAIEPSSYVAPHAHADPRKDETIVVLRGRLGIVTFDSAGEVTQTVVAGPAEQVLGLTLPAGTFHSLVSLSEGTVFFESKAGPYRPPEAHERAAWAPAEQDEGAGAFLERLRGLFD